jgi:hypothetical protein
MTVKVSALVLVTYDAVAGAEVVVPVNLMH